MDTAVAMMYMLLYAWIRERWVDAAFEMRRREPLEMRKETVRKEGEEDASRSLQPH
jgi:hypothetical protein